MTQSDADSIIKNGGPLKELLPLFPSKTEAYVHYARTVAQHYASPGTNCVMCHQSCHEPVVSAAWEAKIHTSKTVLLSFMFSTLALVAGHLYTRWEAVRFVTYHRLCTTCQHLHKRRRNFLLVAENLLFACLIALLLLTVPSVIFLLVLPFIEPRTLFYLLPATVIGIGLLKFVIRGFEACRTSLIPPSIRIIGRSPFSLQGFWVQSPLENSSSKVPPPFKVV